MNLKLGEAIQKLLGIFDPNKPRYVKGTNARDPKTMSPWLKRMRSVKHMAKGGGYLDDAARERVLRRAERWLKTHPGEKAPRHILENAKAVQGGR